MVVAAEAAPPPTGTEPSAPAARPDRFVTGALLLAAPILLLFPLRARLFGQPDMVDPYLHTAVIEHGRDLAQRFGVGDRQLTRAGFTVPGRLTNAAFGDLGGYYAWRYLLVLVAIVPAYLLFARLRGRPAGAVAVVAVIGSPVVVQAWSTDYPMSSAISYLIAGYCCLVMPADVRRHRIAWVGLGGAFLGLAVYSHVVALPLVAIAVLAWTAYTLALERGNALYELGALLVAAAVVSGGLSLLSSALFGAPDLWSPTWRAFSDLRSAQSVALYHSTNWRWILDAPHLLVPALVALMWSALALRRHNGFRAQERFFAALLASQVILSIYLQFFREQWVLEFHYYFSLLWPPVVLVATSTVCELSRALLRDLRWRRWLPAGLVIGIPLVLATLHIRVSFRFVVASVTIGLAIAGIAALARLDARGRSAAAVAGFLVVMYLVTVAQSPAKSPPRRGQAALPKPHYELVFGHPSTHERDLYLAASDLNDIVPAPSESGVPLLLWGPARWPQSLSVAAAQYGWLSNAVLGMPNLSPADVARIETVRPDVLVLLSTHETDLDRGVAALRTAFPDSKVVSSARLHHGGQALVARVVNTGLRAPHTH